MANLRTILVAGIAGGFFAFGGPLSAGHVTGKLAEHVFFEIENYFCQQDSSCYYPEYSEAYKACMTVYLQEAFSEEALDRILHFKKRNGYFQKADLKSYTSSGYGRDMEACGLEPGN